MAMKGEFWAIIGVLVLIGAYNGLNIPFLSGITGGADGQPTQVIEVKNPDKACGSTTMTVDFVEKYNEQVDMTSQNATVFLNGAKKGTYAEGGTFTAQGGNTLDVYNALDSATYAPAHMTGKIPCTGQTASFATSDMGFMSAGDKSGELQKADPRALYKESTNPSVTIEYDPVTGSSQAIGVGQTKTVHVKLSPQFEEGYGTVGGNVLGCRFTDAEIDQTNTRVALGGSVLAKANQYIPSQSVFSVSATNQSTMYWAVPAIDGKSTSELDFAITIKGDDTNEPTASTNFSCELVDTDLYESNSGAILVDTENRDTSTDIGRSSHLTFTLQLA